MKTEEIIIANLSCSGCVNTITKKLESIKGVNKVIVDLMSNTVTVEHEEHVKRDLITKTLNDIGYPEATEKNGLLTQIKSIKSCITGRFSN